MKIRRGDTVQVITGRQSGTLGGKEEIRGARGEVERVIPAKERVVVRGVNTRTRHARPSQQNPEGSYTFDAPVHVSNVMLVDPDSGEPSRVGYRFTDSEQKVRVAKRSGKDIDG